MRRRKRRGREGRGLECEKVKKGERDDIGAPVPQIATHAREGNRTRACKLNVKGCNVVEKQDSSKIPAKYPNERLPNS